ncbi:uncharacterized protein F5Z01DRAFT_632704 [Emericellopsis atlantica]|uniref:Uncharacterized protein n=1 Tax=Emericellopsis atlantica TaxID=2614577 RepID=A0A9P8CSY8_9HYPO|nr:uncharacterized protein F5Z01DRAFT_632704 [Emericellopsis atlantica]KAG9258629.1 hypothetical protein F5Z01DRAFT_632704 [Emericellopsis atlantica]
MAFGAATHEDSTPNRLDSIFGEARGDDIIPNRLGNIFGEARPDDTDIVRSLRDTENLHARHLHNAATTDDRPPSSSDGSDDAESSADDETEGRANFSPTDVDFVRSLLPPTFIRAAYILAAYIQPDEPPYFLYGQGHHMYGTMDRWAQSDVVSSRALGWSLKSGGRVDEDFGMDVIKSQPERQQSILFWEDCSKLHTRPTISPAFRFNMTPGYAWLNLLVRPKIEPVDREASPPRGNLGSATRGNFAASERGSHSVSSGDWIQAGLRSCCLTIA